MLVVVVSLGGGFAEVVVGAAVVVVFETDSVLTCVGVVFSFTAAFSVLFALASVVSVLLVTGTKGLDVALGTSTFVTFSLFSFFTVVFVEVTAAEGLVDVEFISVKK